MQDVRMGVTHLFNRTLRTCVEKLDRTRRFGVLGVEAIKIDWRNEIVFVAVRVVENEREERTCFFKREQVL